MLPALPVFFTLEVSLLFGNIGMVSVFSQTVKLEINEFSLGEKWHASRFKDRNLGSEVSANKH